MRMRKEERMKTAVMVRHPRMRLGCAVTAGEQAHVDRAVSSPQKPVGRFYSSSLPLIAAGRTSMRPLPCGMCDASYYGWMQW